MQIESRTLAVLAVLRGGLLARHVRGWGRIFDLLFPMRKQKHRHIMLRRYGLNYLANPKNYVDWNVLCWGDYEPEALAAFRKRGPGLVCLDVGANVGHHSLFFGSLGWTVHAFEPNPDLWPEFDAKVRGSGLTGIHLHKVGLSDSDAVIEFELENAVNSGTGRFRGDYALIGAGMPVSVGELPVCNGDRYLFEHQIGRVDVIKMDIQGFEPEALAGLKRTIERDRPFACIEISDDNRQKFGSLSQFRNNFPAGYQYNYSSKRDFGPLKWYALKSCTEKEFQELNGNLYCDPSSPAAERNQMSATE